MPLLLSLLLALSLIALSVAPASRALRVRIAGARRHTRKDRQNDH